MHKRFILPLFCSLSLALPAFTQDIDWNTVIEVVQNFTEALNNTGNDIQAAAEVAEAYLQFINSTWPDIDSHIAALSDLPAAIRHTGNIAGSCIFVLSVCIIGASLICVIPQIMRTCRREPSFTAD